MTTREETQDTFGVGEDTLLGATGDRTPTVFNDPVEVNDVTIPAGATLVRIRNPQGSDADALYYLRYTLFGIEIAFEVGSFDDAAALFGNSFHSQFDAFETYTQRQFDQSDVITTGNVDEILGATESIGSQFEREMRALGLEGVPDWIAGSNEAMALMVVAGQEGWSTTRLGNELSGTEAFKVRFPGFQGLSDALGVTDVNAVIDQYVSIENQLSQVLRRYRGPETDVSTEYLGSLIGSGWHPDEVESLVIAERSLKENPDALDNINQQLTFAGMNRIGPDEFLDVMQGNAPPDVYEVLNDAFRRQALADAGIDINRQFAEELGGADNTLSTVDSFSQQAIYAAQLLARTRAAIEGERFGLSREALIATVFNDPDALPEGFTVPQVNELLARIERDRLQAGQGIGAGPAFINQRSRLIIQGLGPTS